MSLVFDISTTCMGINIWFEDSNEVQVLKEQLVTCEFLAYKTGLHDLQHVAWLRQYERVKAAIVLSETLLALVGIASAW